MNGRPPMSGGGAPPSKKRPREGAQPAGPPISATERLVYDLIHGKGNMGIYPADVKREAQTIPGTSIYKILKSLRDKGLIKDIMNSKHRKCLMASQFEPSTAVTGGFWYDNGELDVLLIESMRKLSVQCVEEKNIAEAQDICDYLNKSNAFASVVTLQQTMEIVGTLVLDREIDEVRSTGSGRFAGVGKNKVCYRLPVGGDLDKDQKMELHSSFASIPCGICPRIKDCTPDGLISPRTCVYYNRWLGLDF